MNVEPVAVGATVQRVVTGFAKKLVTARTAREYVVAFATIERTVLLGPGQRIFAR